MQSQTSEDTTEAVASQVYDEPEHECDCEYRIAPPPDVVEEPETEPGA
jgi:hypothetical protein